MRATDNFSGFFTSEDLSQMEHELNKDAPAT